MGKAKPCCVLSDEALHRLAKQASACSVNEPEPVIVVEAMKMRNEFGPKTGGRIKRIMVEPGQSVERGHELAVVVSDGEDPA